MTQPKEIEAMKALYHNSASVYVMAALMAADTPVSPESGNGEDKAPLPELIKARGPRKAVKPEVASVELPAEASPPPAQPAEQQSPAARVRPDYSKARARGLLPTQAVIQKTRLSVIMKPNAEWFFTVHPTQGGYDNPLFIWHRQGTLGKGGGESFRLLDEKMALLIEANGGKVFVGGAYWCQYSGKHGEFLMLVNLESDNDFIKTTRDILEKGRKEWVKRVNVGNCYDSKPPNVPIRAPGWAERTFEDNLDLAFGEIIESEDHPDYIELIHAREEVDGNMSPMAARMARVEAKAQKPVEAKAQKPTEAKEQKSAS
jgi:hypothetical protein